MVTPEFLAQATNAHRRCLGNIARKAGMPQARNQRRGSGPIENVVTVRSK